MVIGDNVNVENDQDHRVALNVQNRDARRAFLSGNKKSSNAMKSNSRPNTLSKKQMSR